MYGRKLAAHIYKLGGMGEVWVHNTSSENNFGNNIDDYSFDREVIAARSYPNRNTEVASRVGDRHRDRPIFVVPKAEDQPDPPGKEDHFVYSEERYGVKAHTEYQTHVEFFGQVVRS